MEHIPEWMYVGMTILLTVALASIGYMRGEYAARNRSIAWGFLMLGWASIAMRFWLGMFDDRTISYAGAIGLLLIAIGTVLEAMRR